MGKDTRYPHIGSIDNGSAPADQVIDWKMYYLEQKGAKFGPKMDRLYGPIHSFPILAVLAVGEYLGEMVGFKFITFGPDSRSGDCDVRLETKRRTYNLQVKTIQEDAGPKGEKKWKIQKEFGDLFEDNKKGTYGIGLGTENGLHSQTKTLKDQPGDVGAGVFAWSHDLYSEEKLSRKIRTHLNKCNNQLSSLDLSGHGIAVLDSTKIWTWSEEEFGQLVNRIITRNQDHYDGLDGVLLLSASGGIRYPSHVTSGLCKIWLKDESVSAPWMRPFSDLGGNKFLFLMKSQVAGGNVWRQVMNIEKGRFNYKGKDVGPAFSMADKIIEVKKRISGRRVA